MLFRSSNAVEESYMNLELIQDVNEYRLPDEILEVRNIFRRSIGSRSGLGAGGTLFEPFNLAYTNTYLLSGTMMGGLATYELFAGYQKLVGRMFGSFIEYSWKPTSHILTILQRPFAQGEQILLRTYNYRPDLLAFDLYNDSGLWWVFAQRNPSVIQDPVFDLQTGVQIYLPKLSSMKKTLGI